MSLQPAAVASMFSRPETALQRAREMRAIKNDRDALQILHGVLVHRKFRMWSNVLPELATEYVELMVSARKAAEGRDALQAFRNLAQGANKYRELNAVLRHWADEAEKKTFAAAEAAGGADLSMVGSLDAEGIADLAGDEDEDAFAGVISPEALLQSATGESEKEREDRASLLPWLRFLWDSYRALLELLRNNARFQNLYNEICERVMNFCVKFNRASEFRRLTKLLRNHLNFTIKYSGQPHSISLAKPDSWQMLCDIRIRQVEALFQMGLWVDAREALQDVHNVLMQSRSSPPVRTMVAYYRLVAKVFWVGDNRLFHAFALTKAWAVIAHSGVVDSLDNVDPADLPSVIDKALRSEVAAQVVLAVVSLPLEYSSRGGTGSAAIAAGSETFMGFSGVLDGTRTHDGIAGVVQAARNKQLELSQLLIFGDRPSEPPARDFLIQEIVSNGALQLADPAFSQLYNVLEVDFQPMRLATKLQPLLDVVADETHAVLNQYLEPLRRAAIIRALMQLSSVYDSITLTSFYKMVPFMAPADIELLVLDAIRRQQLLRVSSAHARESKHRAEASDVDDGGAASFLLDLRFDHQRGLLLFHGATALVGTSPNVASNGVELLLESPAVRPSLQNLSNMLTAALSRAVPAAAARPAIAALSSQLEHDREELLRRHQAIDNARAAFESWQSAVTEYKAIEKAEAAKAAAEAENIRRAKVAAEREEKKRADIAATMQAQEAASFLDNMRKQLGADKLAELLPEHVRDVAQKAAVPGMAARIDTGVEDVRRAGKGDFVTSAAAHAATAAAPATTMSMEQLVRQQMREGEEKRAQKVATEVKRIAKKLDWFERARRERETPRLKKYQTNRAAEEAEYREEQIRKELAEKRAEWEAKIAEKRRLQRMLRAKAAFEDRLMAQRRAAIDAASQKRAELIAEKKKLIEPLFIQWEKEREEEEERRAREEEEAEEREREEFESRRRAEASERDEKARAQREQEERERAEEEREQQSRRAREPPAGESTEEWQSQGPDSGRYGKGFRGDREPVGAAPERPSGGRYGADRGGGSRYGGDRGAGGGGRYAGDRENGGSRYTGEREEGGGRYGGGRYGGGEREAEREGGRYGGGRARTEAPPARAEGDGRAPKYVPPSARGGESRYGGGRYGGDRGASDDGFQDQRSRR